MGTRAVIVFLWAMVLYRVIPRRALGGNAAVDIVLLVLIGSSLSRALTGTAPLLPVIGADGASGPALRGRDFGGIAHREARTSGQGPLDPADRKWSNGRASHAPRTDGQR